MAHLTHIDTPIEGLTLIERHPIADQRGYFERLFCEEELAPLLKERRIAQINRSYTARAGTLRGMHFQYPPHAEMKLVTCLRGEVFDVAVDLRQGSPTLLGWHAERLSADNHRTLLIPEGFAHGFQTLTDGCEMLYLHTAAFEARAEGAVNGLDPLIGIRWPLPVVDMSDRDRDHPLLDPGFCGVSPVG
jgi:dTDP-4-dehydrorhamnose 3,5-epimerase